MNYTLVNNHQNAVDNLYHPTVVLSWLTKLIKGRAFEMLDEQNHWARKLREMISRSKFVATAMALLSSRSYLREVVSYLSGEIASPYRFDATDISRNSLAIVFPIKPFSEFSVSCCCLDRKVFERCDWQGIIMSDQKQSMFTILQSRWQII